MASNSIFPNPLASGSLVNTGGVVRGVEDLG